MQVQIGHINFNKIDNSLKHLTNDQIYEVITKYYNNEKVKDILEEYALSITSAQLVRTFPTVYLKTRCEKCDSQLHGEFVSKTSAHLIRATKSCPECSHKQNSTTCNCEFCVAEREELNKLKKELVDSELNNSDVPQILEQDLTSEDLLYISTILRAGLSEDMTVIESLKKINRKIAPTEKLKKEIINTLIFRNILLVSKKSDLDAFTVNITENGQFDISYQLYEVMYKLNVKPNDDDYYKMVQRLLYPEENLFDDDFCYVMWKKIALNEVEEHLLFEMKKVGYSFNLGEKSYRVFDYLLNHFSVAQIYNMIHRAVANSTKRYQSKEITKIHAQNSVITSCESQGQRAIAENWNLKPYGRSFQLSESIISEVLFNSIMKISSLGFSEVPTKKFR